MQYVHSNRPSRLFESENLPRLLNQQFRYPNHRLSVSSRMVSDSAVKPMMERGRERPSFPSFYIGLVLFWALGTRHQPPVGVLFIQKLDKVERRIT